MRTADDIDVPTSGGRQLSRRSVIRAGAHAAWVVPAIQVVGAAPALAVSCACPPGANDFAFDIHATWRSQGGGSGKQVLGLSGTITNNSGVAQHGLTVCIIVPNTWTGVHSHSTRQDTNKYWTDTYSDSDPRVVIFTTDVTVSPGSAWSFDNVTIKQTDKDQTAVSHTTLTLIASSISPAGKNARGAVTSTN